MKSRIVGLLLLIVTGGGFLYKYISTVDNTSFLDGPLLVISAVPFLIVSAWCVFKDIKSYKQTNKTGSFLYTFIVLFFGFAAFTTRQLMLHRDDSPILIEASGGRFEFDFREDGTYKFTYGSSFGATITRGKYVLKDDNITLDKRGFRPEFISRYLAIRKNDHDNSAIKNDGTSSAAVIYQVDINGNIIERELIFVVFQDYRKSR